MLRVSNANATSENGQSIAKDKLSAMTPRRAFGPISANTPRSGLHALKATTSLKPQPRLFEDESILKPQRQEAAPAPSIDDSFDALAEAPEISIWDEVPDVERAMPPSPARLMDACQEVNDSVVLMEKAEEPIEKFSKGFDYDNLEDYLPTVEPKIPSTLLEVLEESSDEEDNGLDIPRFEDIIAADLTTFNYPDIIEEESPLAEDDSDDGWDEIMEKVRQAYENVSWEQREHQAEETL